MKDNEAILTHVEALGGGHVWDAVFSLLRFLTSLRQIVISQYWSDFGVSNKSHSMLPISHFR